MVNEVSSGILNFILGGKSEFSILQDSTSRLDSIDIRYRVIVSDKNKNLYFVYTECNNSRIMKYHGYLAYSNSGINFYRGKAKTSDGEFNEKAVKGLQWVLSMLFSGRELPSVVHVLHHGRCSRCGRKLKDSESLMCGLGPECRKKVGFR